MQIMASLIVAFTDELFGHVRDDVVLLGMHRHDAPMLGHLGKHRPQVAIGHTETRKGRENFKAGNALLHCFTNLAEGRRGDTAGENVVEGKIRIGMATKDLASAVDLMRMDSLASWPRGGLRLPPGESMTVVTPPKAATRLAASGRRSFTGRPAHLSGTGMAIWACSSIPRQLCPWASMTRTTAVGKVPGVATRRWCHSGSRYRALPPLLVDHQATANGQIEHCPPP